MKSVFGASGLSTVSAKADHYGINKRRIQGISTGWSTGDEMVCNVRTVISGGQLRRKGRPTVPMPRLT